MYDGNVEVRSIYLSNGRLAEQDELDAAARLGGGGGVGHGRRGWAVGPEGAADVEVRQFDSLLLLRCGNACERGL